MYRDGESGSLANRPWNVASSRSELFTDLLGAAPLSGGAELWARKQIQHGRASWRCRSLIIGWAVRMTLRVNSVRVFNLPQRLANKQGFDLGKALVELDNQRTTRRYYVYTGLPRTETDLTKPTHIEHSIERQEVETWAACAGSGSTPQNHRDQCDGLHRCRLPFIVAVKEHSGTLRLIRVTSQALGEESAVFLSREPLPLFDLIEVQLDDGSDRPFIQAKVVDYDRTIGGYQSHVEFLVGEDRPRRDAGRCNPAGSATISPWWSGNGPPPGNA